MLLEEMEMGHLVPGKPPSTGRLELEGQALDGVWRGEGRAGAGGSAGAQAERECRPGGPLSLVG